MNLFWQTYCWWKKSGQPPGMYESVQIIGYLPYQLITGAGFFHQQYGIGSVCFMCVALPRRKNPNQGRWMYVAHQQKCGMWTLSICFVSPWIASHSSFGKRFQYSVSEIVGGTTCMCCFYRKRDGFSVLWILKPHPTYIRFNTSMIDFQVVMFNHSVFSPIPGEMIQSDEHGSNHQLDFHGSKRPT